MSFKSHDVFGVQEFHVILQKAFSILYQTKTNCHWVLQRLYLFTGWLRISLTKRYADDRSIELWLMHCHHSNFSRFVWIFIFCIDYILGYKIFIWISWSHRSVLWPGLSHTVAWFSYVVRVDYSFIVELFPPEMYTIVNSTKYAPDREV